MKRRGLVLLAAGLGASAPLLIPSTVGTAPAHADEACVNVWLVKQDGSRQYPAGPAGACQETGWTWWFNLGTEPTSSLVPGPYKGAGVEFRFTFPI